MPSMSAFRALILSLTAPSALANDFNNALILAAWTGGVGTVLDGSVSLSYSLLVIWVEFLTAEVALLTAICRETIG